MRLPDETREDKKMGIPVIYTIAGVSAFILVILFLVFSGNKSSKPTGNAVAAAFATPTPAEPAEDELIFSESKDDIEKLYKEHKLRAEDLDFWDMYETEATPEPEPSVSPSPEPSIEPTDAMKAMDGKHTLLAFEDGTQEWVEINEDLKPNTYDYTKLKLKNDRMAYYDGNKQISQLGVELSNTNGEVDFEALKQDGIDFVIIRLGSRGYETGVISLDEKFVYNITSAEEAGLEVGVSFFSQAVTAEEATEEARFVIDNLVPYKISYPVAFIMEYIKNDTSRIDILDEKAKTKIADTFLSAVKREGYHALLYGNKEWLLADTIPESLNKYDVWLSQQSSVPDYPYQFQMWEYTDIGKAAGIEGDVSFTVSFIDYTKK